MSNEFTILTATFLTVLALFTTCAYTVKNSARNNMENANANFYICAKDRNKDVAKIYLKELLSWKDICIKHTVVMTNWFYSLFALTSAFLVSMFLDTNYLNKSCLYVILFYAILTIIGISFFISIYKFVKGLNYLSRDAEVPRDAKEFSGEKNWINRLSSKGFLSYKCEPKTYDRDEFDEFLRDLRDDIKKDRNKLLLNKGKENVAEECLTQVKYLNKLLNEKDKQDKDCKSKS